MLIRPATPADVPNVLPMVAKICALHEVWDSAKYGFLPHPEQRYQNWLGRLTNSDSSVFLVAEDEENLVAFLVATVEREIPIYRLKEFAFIHDVWVEPDYRQRGVAREMVILAVESFQKMGIKQIRLDTAAINEAARRLFASCGFRISTIEMLMELSQ
ncbi:acetyltransferase, GNAT family protein [Tolypothrix tenuis PCC 7101]|uniref:Acetyltransferase, GNAT family protein n=1 Tax=Tolypothrix tenuis PCC 7101 TaxID=231146 RepID=A0A1Z4MW52_9CYAN|nr:GNAT family N-acetyltransferase [Aulosira sp. FACHB-113]BAY97685.1 acetyltransferase, GNAT family protein [Tolypothrix tenuis PCC 7101]BAZ71808.1 acetyltransferase, GNAT family protein [Aulosira laxa NIES-50]